MGPRLISTTYLMTREMAMLQAGDLVQRLGHRDCDQAGLLPEMTQWLSTSVIKVLSENMKNKVFMWCQNYSQGWLDEIRAAKADLLEYQYTTSVGEPASLTTAATALQKEISDELDAFKDEIVRAQQENASAVLATMQRLKPGQTSSVESSHKRRRTNTQEPPSDEMREKLLKVDEAIGIFVQEAASDFRKTFLDIAISIDPNFLTMRRSNRARKTLWGRNELTAMREAQTYGLGLHKLDFKLLKRIMEDASDGNVPMRDLTAHCKRVATKVQFEQLIGEAEVDYEKH
ncbi:hypothetical protein FSARC_2045 [Fusarium sarcochroum]|uniref:Uncharacterized protein n=1 Tax=Fusarium sarcochroum TaxID=1208366 RepID=A0A8H4U798_9HYPO|nr:hypothetical protein FSARC_2045 [Fusarium sarcochroum]